MAAAFTSISPHPTSSSLYHKFHPSPLAYSLNSSIDSSTHFLGTKSINNTGRNSSTYRPLRIQNAATKQAKSPGMCHSS